MKLGRRSLFAGALGLFTAKKVLPAASPRHVPANAVPQADPAAGTEWTGVTRLLGARVVRGIDSAGEEWLFIEAEITEPQDHPSYGGATLVLFAPGYMLTLCDAPRGFTRLRSSALRPQNRQFSVAVLSHDVAGRQNTYAKGVTPERVIAL